MTDPMSNERLAENEMVEVSFTADDMAAAWRRTLDNGGTIGPLARLTLSAIEDRARLREELAALQELAVWMTGCGYDFSQHEYFVANRERLSRGAS